MASILQILHTNLIALEDTVTSIKRKHPTTEAALLSYLILEHYRVVDWGAIPILTQIEETIDALGEDNYRINIPASTNRMLGILRKALRKVPTRDSLGNFILQENLPIVKMAPELFPGLDFLRNPARSKGLSAVRDHRYPTPVYKSLWLAYQRAIKVGDSSELSSCIFQVFSSVTEADLGMYLRGDSWEAFLEVEYDPTEEKRIRVPNDFASHMMETSKLTGIPVVRIASYVLWKDLQALGLPEVLISPSLEQLVAYTMRGEYTIAE